MRIKSILAILVILILGVAQAEAGFLGDLVNKTKNKVQQAVEQTVDEQADKTLDIEKGPSGEQSDSAAVKSTSQEAASKPAVGEPSGATDTSNRTIALAVVKLAPKIFELRSDRIQKDLLLQIFPGEIKIRTDDFYWHKNRDALIKKAKALAVDAQTTFEVAPWIDNSQKAGYNQIGNYDIASIGKYDFKKKAFPVYPLQIQIPWLAEGIKSSVAGYKFVGIEQMKENHWVPMGVDEAEQFTKSLGGFMLAYGHFIFTITEVVGLENPEELPEYSQYEKYIKVGKASKDVLRPYFNVTIKGDKVDLYVPTEPLTQQNKPIPKNKLKLFTTLHLDLEMTSSAASVPSDTAKKEKAAKPSFSVPAGIALLQGDDLHQALLGNTVIGTNWAAYFGKDYQVETIWQQKPNKAAFSIKDPLICFDKDSKIATTECIAASLDNKNMIKFYELYGGKQLIPYRIAPGPFPGIAEIRQGRIAALFDPRGYIEAADADVVGIKLGMSLDEVDQIIHKYRGDMKKVVYDGHNNKNIKPWDPGFVHVRYESPDGSEVIGVQYEPPTAGDRVTLIWRTLSYDINNGAPKRDVVIQALYNKYGGTVPGKPKYPSMEVHNWVNNGGGLRAGMNCQVNLNNLPAPISMPGPPNYIDTNCGETLTAQVKVRDGYVTELQVYLVNQAKLAEISKANEKAHAVKTQKGVPKL